MSPRPGHLIRNCPYAREYGYGRGVQQQQPQQFQQPQVRARRTFLDRRPVQGRAVAVQGQYLQRCSSSSVLYLGVCPRLLYFLSVLWKFGYVNSLWFVIPCETSARSREADSDQAMASRGRRGAQAREDGHRREERGEQHALAPQGPTVLPPPPPVDYDTQAALQVQLQAQAQAPALVPQEHGHGGPSIMERFKRMAPPSFKGESQPLLAESWMKEVEKIFWAIRCAEEDKVSLATYMLHVLKALSTACRQESEMDQYMEEKRAAHKRSAPPFQRQDRKKAVYQSLQCPMVATSQQAVTPSSPSFRSSDKKMCPHCGRAHGGTECWKLAGKCLKCGSTEHQIPDCPRLQQGVQRGAPAPVVAAASTAAPVTGRLGRPRAQAQMKDYDAILDLDWLEEHYALVDCRGKKINLCIPGEDEFSHPLPRNLAGRFVISATKAMRMVYLIFLCSTYPKSQLTSTSFDVKGRLMATYVSLTSWLGDIDVQIDGRRLPVNGSKVAVYFSGYVAIPDLKRKRFLRVLIRKPIPMVGLLILSVP
ncbi:hypothetical protein Taro_033314 [Colocasia esculenta]|uniref:CCHC-type domain-containing protein n=1 Tax=Colocasia esculenta TaxID=4460 RepID=A0A843VV03_COLES|nr:hypothetical protein [Colocasia esculenta]